MNSMNKTQKIYINVPAQNTEYSFWKQFRVGDKGVLRIKVTDVTAVIEFDNGDVSTYTGMRMFHSTNPNYEPW